MSMKAVGWLSAKLGVNITGHEEGSHGGDSHSRPGASPIELTTEGSQTFPSGGSGGRGDNYFGAAPSAFSDEGEGMVGRYLKQAGSTVSQYWNSFGLGGGGSNNLGSNLASLVGDSAGSSSSQPSGGMHFADPNARENTDIDENGLPVSKNWYFFNKALGRWDVTPEAPESIKREHAMKLREAEGERLGLKKAAPPPPPPPPGVGMRGPAGVPVPQGMFAGGNRAAGPHYAVPDFFNTAPQAPPQQQHQHQQQQPYPPPQHNEAPPPPSAFPYPPHPSPPSHQQPWDRLPAQPAYAPAQGYPSSTSAYPAAEHYQSQQPSPVYPPPPPAQVPPTGIAASATANTIAGGAPQQAPSPLPIPLPSAHSPSLYQQPAQHSPPGRGLLPDSQSYPQPPQQAARTQAAPAPAPRGTPGPTPSPPPLTTHTGDTGTPASAGSNPFRAVPEEAADALFGTAAPQAEAFAPPSRPAFAAPTASPSPSPPAPHPQAALPSQPPQPPPAAQAPPPPPSHALNGQGAGGPASANQRGMLGGAGSQLSSRYAMPPSVADTTAASATVPATVPSQWPPPPLSSASPSQPRPSPSPPHAYASVPPPQGAAATPSPFQQPPLPPPQRSSVSPSQAGPNPFASQVAPLPAPASSPHPSPTSPHVARAPAPPPPSFKPFQPK